MMHRALCILAGCAVWGSAWAKLPPPTPEEQAAAAQKKAQQAAQQDEQKKALEQPKRIRLQRKNNARQRPVLRLILARAFERTLRRHT